MNNMRKIAYLESKIDMLETEINYLNNLLVETGFPNGIETLKESAIELISEMNHLGL